MSKHTVGIDLFIAMIENGTKPEIEDCLSYCKTQSKDVRLQAMYRAMYKTLTPIFKGKLAEFN